MRPAPVKPDVRHGHQCDDSTEKDRHRCAEEIGDGSGENCAEWGCAGENGHIDAHHSTAKLGRCISLHDGVGHCHCRRHCKSQHHDHQEGCDQRSLIPCVEREHDLASTKTNTGKYHPFWIRSLDEKRKRECADQCSQDPYPPSADHSRLVQHRVRSLRESESRPPC